MQTDIPEVFFRESEGEATITGRAPEHAESPIGLDRYARSVASTCSATRRSAHLRRRDALLVSIA